MGSLKSYIVASTPRTGSSLLCEGLQRTGIAGCPNEPFAPAFREAWLRHFCLTANAGFREYLEAALRYGTTSNGVYGLKIQWMHVAPLARDLAFGGCDEDVLDWLFPGAAFVNIVRRDRRAQAISWYRAIATNQWWRFDGEESAPVAPTLDPDAVRSLENHIELQQSAWERYFSRRGIEALQVGYEELSNDYRGQVARVLSFLDLDASAAHSLPAPRLMRQADDLTRRWRQLMDSACS